MLVVAAHPDDECLGCGASLARFAAEGWEVQPLILGEGLASRPGGATPQELERLKEQCRRACAVLGVREPLFAGLPDNRFDTVPFLDIVQTIEAHLRALRPERVLTHHGGDLNIDHALACRAALAAARPLPGGVVREIWAFETPSSTEWFFGSGQAFEPDTFVDVGETLHLKLAAMECYESEKRGFPHPRSGKALESIARRWGAVAGLEAAEAFRLLRRLI
jgi:LmbE family N-acetylglucosaminyl deacetylase